MELTLAAPGKRPYEIMRERTPLNTAVLYCEDGGCRIVNNGVTEDEKTNDNNAQIAGGMVGRGMRVASRIMYTEPGGYWIARGSTRTDQLEIHQHSGNIIGSLRECV